MPAAPHTWEAPRGLTTSQRPVLLASSSAHAGVWIRGSGFPSTALSRSLPRYHDGTAEMLTSVCIVPGGCLAPLVGEVTSFGESWGLNVVMACSLSPGDLRVPGRQRRENLRGRPCLQVEKSFLKRYLGNLVLFRSLRPVAQRDITKSWPPSPSLLLPGLLPLPLPLPMGPLSCQGLLSHLHYSQQRPCEAGVIIPILRGGARGSEMVAG